MTQKNRGVELLTSGSVNATLVNAYTPVAGVDAYDVFTVMSAQATALQTGGDRIHQAEAMLIQQAVSLQAMFIDLATRAKQQENREWVQTLTGLALRAQSNCTQTLKTLGELRNPRQAVFARQANIAHHQQVNNGQHVVNRFTGSGAQEGPVALSELLEDSDEWLDTRTACTAGKTDQAMEALGAVNRANKR